MELKLHCAVISRSDRRVKSISSAFPPGFEPGNHLVLNFIKEFGTWTLIFRSEPDILPLLLVALWLNPYWDLLCRFAYGNESSKRGYRKRHRIRAFAIYYLFDRVPFFQGTISLQEVLESSIEDAKIPEFRAKWEILISFESSFVWQDFRSLDST